MPVLTPNYQFNQPLVNDPADEDQWGGQLNSNFGSLDSLLKTATDWLENAQTANYTIQLSDRNKVVTMDASGGARAVTLPAPAAANNGMAVIVKKIDASTNAVSFSGTIEATTTLTRQFDTILLISNGSTWRIIFQTVKPSNLPTRTYVTATGSGSFSIPAGVTRVRISVAGAGGGGADGTANGTYGTQGAASTVTITGTGAVTLTGQGGQPGVWITSSVAPAVEATGVNGDFNQPSGGAFGASNAINGNNAIRPPRNGGLAIKDVTVDGTTVVNYTVGAGGAGQGNGGTGNNGYIIFEYAA